MNTKIDQETGEVFNATLDLENKTVISIAPGELKAAFQKMVPFMSEDETRYYLCGIYCAYSKGTLTLCATNGHILCEIKKDLEAVEDGAFELIVPANSVKHLIKVMPTTKDIPYILFKVSKDSKEVEIDSTDFSYTFKPLDTIFPAYKNLIPDGKVKMREGMRAGYLIAALKALGDNPVDISVDNAKNASNEPHLLTSSEAENIKCVIMPVRVE